MTARKWKPILFTLTAVLLIAAVAACCVIFGFGGFRTGPFEGRKAAVENAWQDRTGGELVWYSENSTYEWKYGARYYGTYNGYDILFCPWYLPNGTAIYIGEEYFEYMSPFDLLAYRSGKLLSLQNVYEDGQISAEQLAEIADTHRSYHDILLDLDLKHDGFPTFDAEKRQALTDALSSIGYGEISWCDPSMGESDSFRYYGIYEGYDILVQCDWGPESLWPIRIGGTVFRQMKPFILYAHKDGEIRTLEEVYADGLISDESIVKAANVHTKYCEMLYSDNRYGSAFQWAVFDDTLDENK